MENSAQRRRNALYLLEHPAELGRIQNMENEHRNKLKMAEKLMEDMPHDLFRFVQCYYIGAYDIDHVCVVLEFSRRTFYNRQKALVTYLEGVTGNE